MSGMRSQGHLISTLNALPKWVLVRLVVGLNRDLKLCSAVDTRSTVISVRGSGQVIIGVTGNNPGSVCQLHVVSLRPWGIVRSVVALIVA
jgi:hypothetical protein